MGMRVVLDTLSSGDCRTMNMRMTLASAQLALAFCLVVFPPQCTATTFLLEGFHGTSSSPSASTTSESPYISDFRKQPRSDSRANKPDAFPGFDAAGDVSARPLLMRRRTAAEFYTHFFGKIIGNIGVDKIVDKVERKHDKLQRLSRLARLARLHHSGELRRFEEEVTTTTPAATSTTTTTTTEFVGLSLDDEFFDYTIGQEDASQQTLQLQQNYDINEEYESRSTPSSLSFSVPALFAIPGSYVQSLWANIFANQLRTTVADQRQRLQERQQQQRQQQQQQLRVEEESISLVPDQDEGGVATTATSYLLNPLRSIWDSVRATKSLYVNWPSASHPDAMRIIDEQQHTESQKPAQQHEFANDRINVRTEGGIRKQQLMHQSPSAASVSSATTPHEDDSNGRRIASRIRLTFLTKLAGAKLALQNAFSKYSYLSPGNYDDAIDETTASTGPQTMTAMITMRRPLTTVDDDGAMMTSSRLLSPISSTTNDAAHGALFYGGGSAAVVGGRRPTGAATKEVSNLNNNAIDANVLVVVVDDDDLDGRNDERVTEQINGDIENNTLPVPDESNRRASRPGDGRKVPGSAIITKAGGGRRRTVWGGDDDDGDDEQDDELEADAEGGSSIGEIAEMLGVFVLEIFGSFIGLGWGAFTQIQNLFS